MARSNAGNSHRNGRSFCDDDDDRRGDWIHPRDACDSHDYQDYYGSSRKHGSPVRQGDDRYEYEIEFDKKRDGFDFELDMDRDGKWLDIDVEIGKLDIDLKLDARKLLPDTSPVVSVLGGDGVAVGNDTLVDAEIFSRLIDFGSVTVAFGTAKFSSSAVSGQDPAFASAMTFADVSGADLVFVFNKTTSIFSDCDIPYAVETSTTTFIAIDFEDFDFKQGQITYNFYDAMTYLDGNGKYGHSSVPNLDGNVSILDVDAQAVGKNTLVDVLSSILTLEDQLSSVSAVTVSSVG